MQPGRGRPVRRRPRGRGEAGLSWAALLEAAACPACPARPCPPSAPAAPPRGPAPPPAAAAAPWGCAGGPEAELSRGLPEMPAPPVPSLPLPSARGTRPAGAPAELQPGPSLGSFQMCRRREGGLPRVAEGVWGAAEQTRTARTGQEVEGLR